MQSLSGEEVLEPTVMLLSPRCAPPLEADPRRGSSSGPASTSQGGNVGSLFTLFLTAPLLAFCRLHGVPLPLSPVSCCSILLSRRDVAVRQPSSSRGGRRFRHRAGHACKDQRGARNSHFCAHSMAAAHLGTSHPAWLSLVHFSLKPGRGTWETFGRKSCPCWSAE